MCCVLFLFQSVFIHVASHFFHRIDSSIRFSTWEEDEPQRFRWFRCFGGQRFVRFLAGHSMATDVGLFKDAYFSHQFSSTIWEWFLCLIMFYCMELLFGNREAKSKSLSCLITFFFTNMT